MKQYFLASIFGLITLFAIAQTPQDVAVDSLPPVAATAVVEIPDTLCVTTKSGIVCIPTKDTKALVEIATEIATENKGNWPTTAMGWIALLIGIVFSARGNVALTAGKGIYNFLKVFLRSTLNIVAFIAGIVSAGATLILGSWSFDLQTFTTIWGVTAFLSVYVWETFIKPKKA